MKLPNISIKTMIFNTVLFWPSFVLGGYLLWGKSTPLFLVYTIILTVTIITHRYIICRSCFYYGKPCPSFGFSYLAQVFPKAEDRPFNGKAALIETYIITVCALLPILSLILSWAGVINSYSLLEHILTGIFVVLVLSMDIVHKRTGCNKCEIKDCPLSTASKIS